MLRAPEVTSHMSGNAIDTMAERLAVLSINFSIPPTVPQHLIESHRNAPWLSLSLATLYLSFAKHWLAFLPVPEVWMAVGRRMDDEFFEYVDATGVDLKISDVIVQPAERAAVCQRWQMPASEFSNTVSDTYSVLGLVFADHSNQYTQDLRRGIIRQMEGQSSVLGPLIFVYKRFNQHMYGVECDVQTIDLDKSLRHLCPFNLMFMDALETLTKQVQESAKELPFSL
jgi:hypothetical protein